MIPTIGIMVGSYIVFRCFEVFLFAPSRYGGPVRHGFGMAAAVLLAFVVFVGIFSLLITSGKSGLG